MAKRKKIQTGPKTRPLTETKENAFIDSLLNTGDYVGNRLLDVLANYGCDIEGLVIDTIALSKAWGVMLAVAEVAHLPLDDLFKMIVPTYKKDALEFLKQTKKEKGTN